MNNTVFKCEMCGKALPAEGGVCTACDTKLADSQPILEAQPSSTSLFGKGDLCPSCHNYSAKFEQVFYPENAAWWQLQRPFPRCPICKTILCKKYETKAYRRIYLTLSVMCLLFQFIPRNQWLMLAGYVFGASGLSYLVIMLYRSYRDPIKYVINE